MRFFTKRKLAKEKNAKETENCQDSPLWYIPYEFSKHGFTLHLENGITVKVKSGIFVFMDIQILTPTYDITKRIKKFCGIDFIKSPESLIKILNTLASLPNVYTVHELPDSCFDFNRSGSED